MGRYVQCYKLQKILILLLYQDAFDASYLNYLLDWWDHVCPQPGMGASGLENPMLAQWAANNPGKALPTGPTIGTEDCLHLAVFTPEVFLTLLPNSSLFFSLASLC